MKVYIVMFNDGGGAYVEGVYSNKEKIPEKYDSILYDVDEWEVQE